MINLSPWSEFRGVDDRPEVNDPSHQDKPKQRRQQELHERDQGAALQELSQARNEKAAQGGKNISTRALTGHVDGSFATRKAG
jgi:hypothetical protein